MMTGLNPRVCTTSKPARRSFVACVDDESAMLRAYGRLLRNEPYELLTFEDPARVLAWLEKGPLDAVLSDERMPAMSGTDLLEEVGRRSPQTRCALITAHPDLAVVARETCVPIRRLLTKPWNGEDLKGTIRWLLESSPTGTSTRIELAPNHPGRSKLETTIDLAGATRESILEQLLPLAIWSHASHERPLVTITNSDRLAGSLSAFFKDLARALERLDARLSLRDDSGLLATFLQAHSGNREDNP